MPLATPGVPTLKCTDNIPLAQDVALKAAAACADSLGGILPALQQKRPKKSKSLIPVRKLPRHTPYI